VSGGEWLQIAGGVFEALGLLTVALGISDVRRSFTDKPFFAIRARQAVRRAWKRLRQPRQAVAEGSVSISALSGVSGRGHVDVGFAGWSDLDQDQRDALLRRAIEHLQGKVRKLDSQLADEVSARASADDAAEAKLAETERELNEKIGRAVSSGLGLEAGGVALFLTGVLLTTVGSILA
jgi:hypothetical protein